MLAYSKRRKQITFQNNNNSNVIFLGFAIYGVLFNDFYTAITVPVTVV